MKKRPRKKRHDLTGVSSVGILAEGELDFAMVNTFMMKAGDPISTFHHSRVSLT